MGPQPRECKRSDIEHVRKFVAYAKSVVNETRYYPPAHGYRYMLALVLYSKCITVAEAILVLLDAGFGDEAFGMTRTLVDIFIALRYIANKDADERAKRYAEFVAKSSAVWNEVTELYWPHRVQILDEHTKRLAATYKSPHQWSGETAKTMALEPDTVDVDPDTEEPANHSVAYSITYRCTSHNVHPTIGALRKHMVQAARDHFVVHSGRVQDMAPCCFQHRLRCSEHNDFFLSLYGGPPTTTPQRLGRRFDEAPGATPQRVRRSAGRLKR